MFVFCIVIHTLTSCCQVVACDSRLPNSAIRLFWGDKATKFRRVSGTAPWVCHRRALGREKASTHCRETRSTRPSRKSPWPRWHCTWLEEGTREFMHVRLELVDVKCLVWTGWAILPFWWPDPGCTYDDNVELRVLEDRFVGVVVRASASRTGDLGFESRLRRDFSGVESYHWFKNSHSSCYPARRLAL